MNFKKSVIFAAVIFTVAVSASENELYQHGTNMGLLNFLSRSNDLLQRNPTRSLECFNYYIPLISKITNQYETNYGLCLDASASGRIGAEEATADQRKALANRAEASCNLFRSCIGSESVEGEFECYIKGGAENAKNMYAINADASDELANLSEVFRLIEYKKNKCTTDTKREYEKKSSEAYGNLNNCISGISEVPTEAPETEAPGTEAPTTEAPATEPPTTEPPTTEPPTKEPPTSETSTTEAPETEAPGTEAPTTEASATDPPSTEPPTTEPASTEPPTTEAPSTEESSDTEENSTEENSTEENSTEENSTEENSTEENSTEENSTKETDETEEDKLPEEDLIRKLALKKLKYRLENYKV